MAQDGPKMAPDSPKMAFKIIKKPNGKSIFWLLDCILVPIIPKMAQDGPNLGQDGLKMARDGPKMAHDGPKMAQDGFKMASKRAQNGPR